MKIALVCRTYPTHRPGGMPFVCKDRAIALVKAGHEVHVLSTGPAETLEHDGVTVFHANCPPDSYSLSFADSALNHCRKWYPDVVHFDSFCRDYMWHKDLPKKVVTACTMHGFGFGAFLTGWNLYKIRNTAPEFNPSKLFAEARALSTFKVVIGVSIHEHWMLKDIYGLFHAKLVYNPIAECFFKKPIVAPTEKNLFLCAAISSHSTRQFDIAAKAAEMAGATLLIASKVPRHRMPELYDKSKGAILPTAYAQGYDLVVGEANARGRCVIASATGSYLREAEYNKGIVLVPLNDVKALAAAMNQELPNLSDQEKHHPDNHAVRWLEALS